MSLPISVVVPRTKENEAIGLQYCIPSIRDNGPAEIIEEEGDGDLCAKRKAGAAKATQPFLMFVDENIVLYEWTLKKMMLTLEEFKDVAFVYCDARVFAGTGSGRVKSRPWDPTTIQAENYVRIASLMRRELFPSTVDLKDPGGRDIWTALAASGHRGLYIGEVLFEVHENRNVTKKAPDENQVPAKAQGQVIDSADRK